LGYQSSTTIANFRTIASEESTTRKEFKLAMVEREYLKVSELAQYTGISDRTLWDLLKDPVNPIPHYRIGAAGRIVRIKKSEFDQWMREQKVREGSLVDDVLEGILD
jgi:excisionase family DNA binding protein